MNESIRFMMNAFRPAILICLLLTGAINSLSAQVICSSSILRLDSVVAVGGDYEIHLNLCVAGGVRPNGRATREVAFALYDQSPPANQVQSFTPSLTGDTTSTVLTGTDLGPVSTGWGAGAFSVVSYTHVAGWPFACHNSPGCGSAPYTECHTVVLVTDELPDSIRVFGVESSGSMGAGCEQFGVSFLHCFPVLPALPLDIDAGPDTIYCSGVSLQMGGSPTSANASSFSWSPGTNLSNTSVSNPTLLTNSGVYTYTLTVQGAGGCTLEDIVRITESPVLGLDIGPDTIDICGSDTLNLCTEMPNYMQFIWNTGDVTACKPVTLPGNYVVSVTDPCGVTTVDSTYIRINPCNLIGVGADTVICADTFWVDVGPGFALVAWFDGYIGRYHWLTNAYGQEYGVWVEAYLPGSPYPLRDSIYLTFDSVCVWPGDANYDLVANNNDLLAIGVAYAGTGPVRPWATLSWTEQGARSWSQSFTGGANYKHADCDGNGLVDTSDIAAINLNYGSTHNKTSGATAGGGPDLWFENLQDSVAAGDTLQVIVSLGRDTLLADSVYGIAFTMNYDSSLVDSGGVWADFSNSWLGTPGTDLITLTQDLYQQQAVDLALCRTDGQDRDGWGEICRISIVMQDDIVAKTHLSRTLRLALTDVTMITSEEDLLAVSTGADSLTVYNSETAYNTAAPPALVKVYPNPAGDRFVLESPSAPLHAVTIHSPDGRIVGRRALHGAATAEIRTSLPAGLYLIRIETAAGTLVRKLAIR